MRGRPRRTRLTTVAAASPAGSARRAYSRREPARPAACAAPGSAPSALLGARLRPAGLLGAGRLVLCLRLAVLDAEVA